MKIKFLSLNLWQGGNVWENMVKFLEKETPDILCLQEVYQGEKKEGKPNLNSLPSLRKNLEFLSNYYESYFPFHLHERPEGDYELGVAILSRFPMKNHQTYYFQSSYTRCPFVPPQEDYSSFPKGMQSVEISINNRTLHVFNIHGVWGFDGDDNSKRLAMSKFIISQIKDQKPLILSGDFNVNPWTETIHNLEKYLRNVFKDELTTSFNMKYKTNPGYQKAVADMTFISSDIHLLDHFCPEVDVSDHLPLISVFEV